MSDERDARRALACVTEAGELRLARLIERQGAERLWDMVSSSTMDDPWTARARRLDLAAVRGAESAAGLRFVVPDDDDWPGRLDDLGLCPPVQDMGGVPLGLWVRGSLPLAHALATSVSIVGSRASSAYGDRVAADLGAELATAGFAIVSGGAYGIDAAAHRGALADRGTTVAFLAGGADEPYPRAHASLLDAVAASGAVVSEYPPGAHPTRPRFLARNRLIAAASGATVMVEAAVRSGARNTVTWAVGCGRPVGAVPGPVGSATSFTPHRLIREGEAVLVTGADDVRELLAPLGEVEQVRPRRATLLDELTDEQRSAYEALPARGGKDAGEVSLRAGLAMGTCLAVLDGLSAEGLAERRADGTWRLGRVRNRPRLANETKCY